MARPPVNGGLPWETYPGDNLAWQAAPAWRATDSGGNKCGPRVTDTRALLRHSGRRPGPGPVSLTPHGTGPVRLASVTDRDQHHLIGRRVIPFRRAGRTENSG